MSVFTSAAGRVSPDPPSLPTGAPATHGVITPFRTCTRLFERRSCAGSARSCAGCAPVGHRSSCDGRAEPNVVGRSQSARR